MLPDHLSLSHTHFLSPIPPVFSQRSSPLDPLHHASHGPRPAGHVLLHAAIVGRSRRTEGRNFAVLESSFYRSPFLSHPENVAMNLGCARPGEEDIFRPTAATDSEARER